MSVEVDILKTVCQKLEQANIPYMLTGSLAANFYAVPRMTRDIDIVIQIMKKDAQKMHQTFQEDFYVSENAIIEAVEYQTAFNIIHNHSIVKIDFIIRKNEVYRSTEFQRKQRILVDGTPIWIVSPEDLIISKLFWAKDSHSEMQLKDINNILLNVKKIDKVYILKWVETLDLSLIFEKVRFYG